MADDDPERSTSVPQKMASSQKVSNCEGVGLESPVPEDVISIVMQVEIRERVSRV